MPRPARRRIVPESGGPSRDRRGRIGCRPHRSLRGLHRRTARPSRDRSRLTAYAEAGADCLYAPGIRTRDEITTVVGAVAPRPVNVLAGSDFATVAELARLGVRRISVGGALARAAWTGFLEAAREIADRGTFAGLGRAAPFADVNGLFRSE